MKDQLLIIRFIVAIPLGIVTFPIISMAATGIGIVTITALVCIVENSLKLLGDHPDAKSELMIGLSILSAPFWMPVHTWSQWVITGKFPN